MTMATGTDAPSWTFGLNPKIPGPRIPGPGAYDIAGRLVADGVGTYFAPIGKKPQCARANHRRLVFAQEDEEKEKPGPGTYEIDDSQPLHRKSSTVVDAEHQPPRFPSPSRATHAGPGAYIPHAFTSKGPAYSITARPPTTTDMPTSPGPGQYIEAPLSAARERQEATEGFGKRNSPRFAVEPADGPGPGAYQSSSFEPRLGRGMTFGRLIRPAGWSAKIRDIAPFPWELDGDTPRLRRFRAPLRRNASSHRRSRHHRGRPSSAPPSSRLRRACARGRRLTPTGGTTRKGGRIRADDSLGHASPPMIAEAMGGRWRGRTPQAPAGSGRRGVVDAGSPRLFGTAPQRPLDAPPAPGPSSYHPLTLDEATRIGKVFGLGSKSGRELFPPAPDTPGPVAYAPEITRRPGTRESTRPGLYALPSPSPTGSGSVLDGPLYARGPRAGTFGLSERFPRDLSQKPGVGEYDLRAAEKPGGASGAAMAVTFGRKPAGAPYVPELNRYLHADDRTTPSAQYYRPESAAGGGGECGVGGHAPAPPAWSFGSKRLAPRPPDGPGPGSFRPPYEASTPAARFGVGREVVPGCISGVPWTEAEELVARGEMGGRDAKLYLPARNRMGARTFMRSRRLPKPGKGGDGGRRKDDWPALCFRSRPTSLRRG